MLALLEARAPALEGLTLGLGLAGAALNILWPLLRGRGGMLLGQSGVSICFGLHFLLTGASTACVMNVLALLQALIAIPLGERPGFRIAYLGTLPFIAGGLWYSWDGLPSLFAALGFALISLGRYQLSPVRFRLLMLLAVLPWIGHNVSVGSIPGLISDACALSTGAFALRRALRASS